MICVRVPATSANCSVGFDCLGMALDWTGKFYFEKADCLLIEGCPAQYQTRDNLVIQAYEAACAFRNVRPDQLHLRIETDVPFARGLGSSSCCIAAGIEAANTLQDLQLSAAEKLEIATALEGHPDNVAPALFGSMNACFVDGKQIVRVRLNCADFKALVIVPPYEVKTADARKVLPAELPFKEAVRQTGHALVFEKALEEGNEHLLYLSCSDVLHEPYRKALIAHYEPVAKLAHDNQIPFWISGSGPTMLMLSKDESRLEALQGVLRGKYPELDTRILSIARQGAKVYV